MNDNHDNEIADQDILAKLMREEIDRRKALVDLTYYAFLDCLYAGWMVDCEPESHIDFERVWRLMTGEEE